MEEWLRADTPLPVYVPLPHAVLSMDISGTAKLAYAVLLARAVRAQRNGHFDEAGRVYIVFPVKGLAGALDCGPRTVEYALRDLEAAG